MACHEEYYEAYFGVYFVAHETYHVTFLEASLVAFLGVSLVYEACLEMRDMMVMSCSSLVESCCNPWSCQIAVEEE